MDLHGEISGAVQYWALFALYFVMDISYPNVWLSSWAFVTLPHNLEVTLWLDPDCTQVHVPLNMPLLLQFWAEHADVQHQGSANQHWLPCALTASGFLTVCCRHMLYSLAMHCS